LAVGPEVYSCKLLDLHLLAPANIGDIVTVTLRHSNLQLSVEKLVSFFENYGEIQAGSAK